MRDGKRNQDELRHCPETLKARLYVVKKILEVGWDVMLYKAPHY